MRKNINMLKNQKGLTLIEVLIALVLGLLAIAAVTLAYKSTQDKQRQGDLLTSTMTLQTNVRDLYYGKNDYGTDNDITSTIISAGGVPANLVNNNGNGLVSPYDNTKNIAITGKGSTFEIAVSGIPQEPCVTLSSRIGSFKSVEANGTAVTDVDDAVGACTEGDNNVVTFVSN